MTPDDVKQIRAALGDVVGRRISQRDLGLALGISEGNADRAVREWETTGPTGPAAAALRFMGVAAGFPAFYLNREHWPGNYLEIQRGIEHIVREMFVQAGVKL